MSNQGSPWEIAVATLAVEDSRVRALERLSSGLAFGERGWDGLGAQDCPGEHET